MLVVYYSLPYLALMLLKSLLLIFEYSCFFYLQDFQFVKSLLLFYSNVYHITFKICKGNTKGRRRGGLKKSRSKNRGAPLSLPLGFPSALSFLTHPHLRLDFCKSSYCTFLKFSIVTVRATLIIYYILWCAQPT